MSGCSATRELTARGYEVTLIERNNYLGGGCHTFFWGGHPYTEGPRPFSVTGDKIFDYINEIVPMRTFHLYLDTYIERDRAFYSFPIHWDDIQSMPDKDKILKELDERPKVNDADNLEDGWINAVGYTLYDKYVKTYTEKMWEVESNKVFPDFSWSVKGNPIQRCLSDLMLYRVATVFSLLIAGVGAPAQVTCFTDCSVKSILTS